MRQPLDIGRLQAFMKTLGATARTSSRVYLVGGASAILLGWRASTVDVDLKFVPDNDEILRTLPRVKELLHINIELASPDDFIPELPGWEDRSEFIQQEGKLTFCHYDFYAQTLAKIERAHDLDLIDVDHFIRTGLVKADKLWELFSAIEDQIYRYPELDHARFRKAVESVVQNAAQKNESV